MYVDSAGGQKKAPEPQPAATPQREVSAWKGTVRNARSEVPQAPPTKAPTQQFDELSLYGPEGRPFAADIRQGLIGDCTFLATLGAFAKQRPGLIQRNIRYDRNSGNFIVTMYPIASNKPGPNPVQVTVTQADINDNIRRRGGSALDDGVSGAPIWPAVMEVAYAKMLDFNHSDRLDQGYQHIGLGGAPEIAMYMLSGSLGTPQVLLPVQGPFDYDDRAYDTIKGALDEGRPITLGVPFYAFPGADSGVLSMHVYSVEDIRRNAKGDVELVLRNPWGSNRIGGPRSTDNPTIVVKLDDLKRGSRFTIGASAPPGEASDGLSMAQNFRELRDDHGRLAEQRSGIGGEGERNAAIERFIGGSPFPR